MTSPLQSTRLSVWGAYALFLLLIPLIFFPLRTILQPDALPPIRLELHVHAASMGLWCLLVVIQSVLISNNQHGFHRKLGFASIALASMLVISGVIVNFQFYERTDLFRFFVGGMVSLAMFSVFFAAGVLWRRETQFHRRMMIFAVICVLPAALNRVAFVTGISPQIMSGPIWILLAALVPVYDFVRTRRLSHGSQFGIVVWVVAMSVNLHFTGSVS